MSALTIFDKGKFAFYSVTEHGIAFDANAPKSCWLEVFQQLSNLYDGAVMTQERTLQFMADALNFGEGRYGEDFSQAVSGAREALGLTPKTLANAMWVYKKIGPGERKNGVRLGHYSVIAGIEDEKERGELIGEVLEKSFTVKQLKERIAETYPKTKRGNKRSSSKETEESAIKKLEELGIFISTIPDLGREWKEPVAVFYRIYRRRWCGKGKK